MRVYTVDVNKTFNVLLNCSVSVPCCLVVSVNQKNYFLVDVDRILASVSVSAPNVDKWALSADIRFRPKAVVSHSVHFRFRRAAVGKFGGCRK